MPGTAMRRGLFILLLVLMLTGVSAGPGLAFERKVPQSHPIELTSAPICTECHTDDTGVALRPVASFNHSADFISGHRFAASATARLCAACHAGSFCTDCHAHKDGLKPSDRYSSSPERWLPHRGDYLFQHRIDGRLDPTSCYRCHGTRNNSACKRCHR